MLKWRENMSTEETNKKIAEALDLEVEKEDNTPIRIDLPEVQEIDTYRPDSIKSQAEADIDVDYEESRKVFKKLIDNGMEAIDGILDLAAESEQPRAYEVAATLIKTVSDANEKIHDLHKKMKELKRELNEKDKTNISVQNGIFVGTAVEFQNMLKQNTDGLIDTRGGDNNGD